MADPDLSKTQESEHFRVLDARELRGWIRTSVDELVANAASLKHLAAALDSSVVELMTDAAPDRIRESAAAAQASILQVVVGALAARGVSERLVSVAEVMESVEPMPERGNASPA